MGSGINYILFYSCLSFILCLIAHPLHGSPQMKDPGSGQQFIAEQWTTNNGLPINHINQVYQTPDGFLWLATFNGLIRFDGYTFREFNAGNTPALTSNRIIAIQPGIGNSFWINTEQGNLLLVKNGEFTSFEAQLEIDGTISTPDNRILVSTDALRTWIGTRNGLFLYQNGEMKAFQPDIFHDRNISAIYTASDNMVRVFDHEGFLWVIDTNLNAVQQTGIPLVKGANAVARDQNGVFWLGRNEIVSLDENGYHPVYFPKNYIQGWDRLHPYFLSIQAIPDGSALLMSLNGLMKIENDTIKAVDLIENKTYGSFAEMLGNTFTTCPDSSVWAIIQDRLYKNGAFVYRTAAKGRTIFCDNEHNLWVATDRDGLFRYRRSLLDTITFSHSSNNFYGVFIDSYNTFWAGGVFSDLTQVDAEGVVHEVMARKNEGTTSTFLEATDGSLWNGYHRCRPVHRTAAGACLDFEPLSELTGKNVFTVFEDSYRRIWFGTNEGLFRLIDGVVEELTPPGLAQRMVRYILESGDSSLWLATNGGGILNYRNGESTRYTIEQGLSSNNIRSLLEDEDGNLWIATEDMGLNRLNPTTGKVSVIRKQDGLFEDGLHKMIPDDYGRLWISTNHGIFWVPFEHLQQFADGESNGLVSTYYNERDGMLNREANGGFQNSGFSAANGRIYFPTQNGVIIIDPNRIGIHSPLPMVILEDIQAGNDRFSPFQAATNFGKDQRSFSIQYTSPFFTATDRVRFSYKLEGFDQDWNDAGSRRQAIYTNIPAGRYQFHVKADLGNDETASAITTHAIVISPYFYETRWFPVLILLLVAMVIAGGYQLRLRHLVRKEKLLEKIVERRTEDLRTEKIKTEEQAEQLRILSQEKNRFFANISHEFRTPLSLIIGPLTDLRDGKYGSLSMEAKVQADMTLRNSRRLLRLVGQLMDLARLEEKKFKINLKTGNICRYLVSLAEPFRDAADQKSIRFNIEIPQEAIICHFDPGHFDKIVANLLSNAFKFTPENGTVTLRAEKCADEVMITVSDTGPGIEAVHLPRLFDRFYQVKKSELQPGSGIGLALAKELTELHHGKIEVQSEVNRGSTFIIHLPVLKLNGASHPQIETISSLDESDHSILRNGVHAAEPGESLEEHETIQKTILIVDDHAEIRAYLKEHLAEHFAILEAESGNEALIMIEDHLPDLIVSDVMMQDGDGIHLLKNIRNNPDISFLPVILLTAKAEAEDRLSGLDVGATEYITKPFNIRELKARVKNIFEQQKRLKFHLINSNRNTGFQIHHDTVHTESADDTFLKSVKEVIQVELPNEDFSVEILAQKVNQSRSNLHRRLTALTGETPSAMIRRIRLELGAQLLSQNAGTVSEIAYSTGFKSVSHFSRAFAQHFGKSPSQYQETVE
jgi:signal transduction histidine kinase/ligand-binding sensor domain-containing protein/DNA-binding response OmpR family regulator